MPEVGGKKPEKESGMSTLPYTVLKIEGSSLQHPKSISSGTGFFYSFHTNKGNVMMLVTNKHVVDGLDRLHLHMPLANADGNRVLGPAEVKTINTKNYPILRHPNDNVDLAIVAAEPILVDILKTGKAPYNLSLSKENLPPEWLKEKLSAFVDVLMIGFPNGLMDDANNLPISRRGILSTHYYADYNGEKNFVIDIAAFGGSSGSPVFVYFDYTAPTEHGWELGKTSAYLIGVLHSGPIMSVHGEVVPAPIPTARQVSKTSLMMHLGYCAKAELLDDFIPLLEENL